MDVFNRLGLVICLALSAAAVAQDTSAPPTPKDEFPFEGEVTGNNVYIRSGAGAYWYPTRQVNTGTRVRVIGREIGGWLKIVPPEGSFSYVEAAAIERDATNPSKGVTKVDQVYVKPGSDLSTRKNAVQQILPKGVEVNIIGEAEGFLKITPPQGAYLYISERFVRRAGEGPALKPPTIKSATPFEPRPTAPITALPKTEPQPTPTETPHETSPAEAAPREIVPHDSAPAPTPDTSSGSSGPRVLPARPDYIIPPPAGANTMTTPPIESTPTITPPSATESTHEASEFVPSGTEDSSPFRGEPEPVRPAPRRLEPPRSFGNDNVRVHGDLLRAVPGSSGKYRALLESAEADLRNILNTELRGERLPPLIDRYKQLAAQQEDPVAQAVAQARVDQLGAYAELERIVAEAKVQQTSASSYQAQLGQERDRIINARLPAELRPWDLRGELRPSKAWPDRKDRYRLQDPLTQRTVAYIDIPSATGIEVLPYLEKYVGIRTASQYFSTSAKVPIAVATEISVLPRAGTPTQTPTPTQTVSPAPGTPPPVPTITKIQADPSASPAAPSAQPIPPSSKTTKLPASVKPTATGSTSSHSSTAGGELIEVREPASNP